MGLFKQPEPTPRPIVADASRQRLDSLPSIVGSSMSTSSDPIKPLTKKAETAKPTLIGGA